MHGPSERTMQRAHRGAIAKNPQRAQIPSNIVAASTRGC